MAYNKITEADLLNRGVIGLPDTPALTASEMQAKFEEVARDVIIPAFNLLIDALVADMGNIYTKEEVVNAIRERVTAVGAGDMAQYVYDTDGDGIVDKAEKLAKAVKIGGASFDGSAGITLAQMGAAASSHNHTKANITDMPTSLKNPTALTVQFNGTPKATYDGSNAQTVNVTPGGIGAASKASITNAANIVTIPTVKEAIPTGTTNTWKNLFTAPENGFYFISVFSQWTHKNGGYRNSRLSTQTGGLLNDDNADVGVHHLLTDCVYLSAGQVLQLGLRQTSGADLNCEYGGRYSYIPI